MKLGRDEKTIEERTKNSLAYLVLSLCPYSNKKENLFVLICTFNKL